MHSPLKIDIGNNNADLPHLRFPSEMALERVCLPVTISLETVNALPRQRYSLAKARVAYTNWPEDRQQVQCFRGLRS